MFYLIAFDKHFELLMNHYIPYSMYDRVTDVVFDFEKKKVTLTIINEPFFVEEYTKEVKVLSFDGELLSASTKQIPVKTIWIRKDD